MITKTLVIFINILFSTWYWGAD